MITNERDAGEMRCCGPEGAGNPGNENDGRRWCAGRQCMGWRWADENPDSDKGFCGVAGVPVGFAGWCAR